MAKIHEYVEAELENIQRVIAELPDEDSVEKLSTLELAGAASLIHNFYNGVENILKQIVGASREEIPIGPSWHRDLLNLAVSRNDISEPTAKELRQYLAFRHFFSHAYSFDLDKNRIIPLLQGIPAVLASFISEINKSLEKIN
jgi:uncharacterized protein YutE (UPF0331/DUF86 family)